MGKVILHNSTGRPLWIRLKTEHGHKVAEAKGDSLIVIDMADGESASLGIFESLNEIEEAFGPCTVVPTQIVPHRSDKR